MKKIFPIIEAIPIVDISSEGLGVGKKEDLVIFVKKAIPGDIVNARIIKKHRRYSEAEIESLVHASPHRIPAKCAHFGDCGGCKWQHFDYAMQLETKQNLVTQAIQRIGKVEVKEFLPIVASEKIFYYRNKLEYSFANSKWLTREQIASDTEIVDKNAVGFHVAGFFDKILDITQCHLQEEPTNAIRNHLRELATNHSLTYYDVRNHVGFFRNTIIRISATTGEIMVLVSFGENQPENIRLVMQSLKDTFPAITSLLYVVNTKKNDTIHDLVVKVYHGKAYIEETMEDLRFKIGSKSFYQTNSLQAYQLYSITRDFAAIQPSDIVYDLYTGVGTIALFVAKLATKVVGIEYVEAAIVDANENARYNTITNTHFVAGDMKKVFTNEFVAIHGKPDVIITDPPRAGMDKEVIEQILQLLPTKIVYVSCNPSTQARDLELLSSQYEVQKIQPVDMFPHTTHVESVALLIKK